jgi:hypothetical protein
MPLKPVSRIEPMPVATEKDVRALFDLAVSLGRGAPHPGLALAEPHRSMAEHAPDLFVKMEEAAMQLWERGLADHFYYVGAVHPEHFRPLHREAVALTDDELERFALGFPSWLYLLQDASDDCVDTLASKLRSEPEDWERLSMLAAILTPAALDALAGCARGSAKAAAWCEDTGFWIPPAGPAQPRFFLQRSAIRAVVPADPFPARHPIGLPVSDVSAGDQPEIDWHYLTLDLSGVPGIPDLPFRRLHLVSPRADCGWSLAARVSPDDRYSVIAIHREREHEGPGPRRADSGYAELLPFDDSLTYTNGHVMSTEGVEGIAGGPPIGLYPNPRCPDCGRLMLHICAVSSRVREYGEGFRNLAVCEDCRTAACTGVMWN